MPLRLKLCIKSTLIEHKKLILLPKLVWKDSQKDKYIKNLNKNQICQKTQGDFMNLEQLVNVIKKSIPTHKSPVNNTNFKAKLFTRKCLKARNNTFDLLNKFRKTNEQEDKNKYLQAKKHYVKKCRKRK